MSISDLEEQQKSLQLEVAQAELPELKKLQEFLNSTEVQALVDQLQQSVPHLSKDSVTMGVANILGSIEQAKMLIGHRVTFQENLISSTKSDNK